jgi:HD-like signal output (HDOD) protein/outer membrane biosynthesis protein TonB
MATDLLSLQNKLINGQLPVLDATLERFNLLSNRQTTTHAHLAEIIRSDIGYTLAMFKAVNSHLPATRDPVQTIEHAISMLGVPKTNSIGHELLKISTLPETAQIELKDLYSQAFHASQYFQALAIQSNIAHPEETVKNIRLMNLAQVLLWSNRQDAIESHTGSPPGSSPNIPFSLLDKSMRELGLAIATAWKLPTDLQQSLEPVSEEKKLATAMITATEVARQTAIDWHNATLIQLVDYWTSLTEAPGHRVMNTLHQLAAETARQIDDKHLPVPAFSLLFPAPPGSETTEDPVQAENPDKEPVSRQQPEPKPPRTQAAPPVQEKREKPPIKDKQIADQAENKTQAENKPESKTVPAVAPLQKVKPKSRPRIPEVTPETNQDADKKPVPSAPKQPASPLQQLLKNMQQETGVSRIMFAVLTTDRKKLGVKFVLGAEQNDTLRHFQADLTNQNIFSLLMKKPQGIHLTRENYKKYLQLIPAVDQKSLQINNLYAVSVFAGDKPIGLFVADNKKHVLTAENYQKFRQFCLKAVNVLINGSSPKEPEKS